MNKLTAAAALALVALFVAAPAASAGKPPRSFYGVVPQTQLGPDDYAKMGAARVGTLRTPFVWSAIDPSALPGDEDWSQYDPLIGQAAINGVSVLPTVTTTPQWVSNLDQCTANCEHAPPRGIVALAAWRGFLHAAVQRYGPDGSFWAENPQIPKLPIHAWQIWNEQNSPTYFAPEPNVDAYAKLVTEASRAIEDVDPTAEVILGGMFYSPLGGEPPAMFATDYLRQLYARPGFEDRFDGVAVHPYAQSFKTVKILVDLMRKESARAGDGNVGYWLTEVGWASGGASHPLVVGPRKQAKKLRQAFTYFTKKRRKMNIRQIDWFSWRDTPPSVSLCVWCPESGLFTRDGFAPKPALKAYMEFTKRK